MTCFSPVAMSLTPLMTSTTNSCALGKFAAPIDADLSIAKQIATPQVLPVDWALLTCREPRERARATINNIILFCA